MTENKSDLMQDIQVSTSTGQDFVAEFNTVAYAEGLKVDYSITMSFLRPNSGPHLYQSEIQKIVFESLSAFLKELEKEL